jgi:hypothetical protein
LLSANWPAGQDVQAVNPLAAKIVCTTFESLWHGAASNTPAATMSTIALFVDHDLQNACACSDSHGEYPAALKSFDPQWVHPL